MRFFHNKKGLEMTTLIVLIIAIIGTGIALEATSLIWKGAKAGTALDICRNFLTASTQFKTTSSKLCQPYKEELTHEGKAIISDGLIKPEGAAARDQKRDAAEKMIIGTMKEWYETGSGMVLDIWINGLLGQSTSCFPGFKFRIEPTDKLKRDDKITKSDIYDILFEDVYLADRIDDNCAKLTGGFCLSSCSSEAYPDLTKETESAKCPKDEVCCISEKTKEDCLNYGGRCKLAPTLGDQNYKNQANWHCSVGKCYVIDEIAVTYLEYIQEYEGRGTLILEEEYIVGREYVIAAVDPAQPWIKHLGATIFDSSVEGIKNAIAITELDKLKKQGCYIIS